MSKLLILPANKAIRVNPIDPTNGFPTVEHQELVPGVAAALDFYKREGYAIAVCENAGSVDQNITPLEVKLTELIVLMTDIAPQIDHLIFCTDYQGAYAYWLSKDGEDNYPVVRRLKSKRANGRTNAPGDSSASWDEIDCQPFRKPDTGMVDVLISELQPTQTVGVWERDEDLKCVTEMTFDVSRLFIQSAEYWRTSLNPNGTDYWQTPATQPAPRRQGLAAPSSSTRKFRYINPSENASKFWEITLCPDQMSFTINYGRIGTRGRSEPITKHFPTPQEAKRDYDSRIQSQLRSGYIEVI